MIDIKTIFYLWIRVAFECFELLFPQRNRDHRPEELKYESFKISARK
jgi:hypothetical protein